MLSNEYDHALLKQLSLYYWNYSIAKLHILYVFISCCELWLLFIILVKSDLFNTGFELTTIENMEYIKWICIKYYVCIVLYWNSNYSINILWENTNIY